MLRTPSGRIELAPEPIVADVDRLRASLEHPAADGELVLIGRRQLRSNNSWMHNLPVLVKGKPRCTLHVHPDDAQRPRTGRRRAGASSARGPGASSFPVEVTDAVMPGVVSLPHGWGHDVAGTAQRWRRAHAGTNSNLLADELLVDAVSGNAVLNGIPVELAAVRAELAV